MAAAINSDHDQILPEIIQSKLSPPQIHRTTVSREGIQQLLQKNFESLPRLMLLSAPPGYGKTISLVHWLNSSSQPFGWLTIDSRDNDILRFLLYILTAVCGNEKGIEILTDVIDSSTIMPPADFFADLISRECAGQPESFVLVLDDYHTIVNPKIHEVITLLLSFPSANLMLCILTREDPPFKLSRLRLQGIVTEIRMEQLKFSREELRIFISGHTGISLSNEQSGQLLAKTEGWPAAVALCADSFMSKSPEEISVSIESFSGQNQYVIDYFMEEIMETLDEPTLSFLAHTAFLNHLHDELCDFITRSNSSREILHKLRETNLFVIPLGDEHSWYRYHHLFTDFLRDRFRDQIPTDKLYKEICLWCEGKGYLHEAIHYAALSKDSSLLLHFISSCFRAAFQNGHLLTLKGWIDILDQTQIDVKNVNSMSAILALVPEEDIVMTVLVLLISGRKQIMRRDYVEGKDLCTKALHTAAAAADNYPDLPMLVRSAFEVLLPEENRENFLPQEKPQQAQLSKRELEVLRCIAEGLSNSEIGERLFISPGTVKWHVNNIFSKLDVKNRTGAVKAAGTRNLL